MTPILLCLQTEKTQSNGTVFPVDFCFRTIGLVVLRALLGVSIASLNMSVEPVVPAF